MGLNCCKPKKSARKLYHSVPISPSSTISNSAESLKDVLDRLYDNFAVKYDNGGLLPRMVSKRLISKNESDKFPAKMPRYDITFFTDKYTLDDLESFLVRCSEPPVYPLHPEEIIRSLTEIILSSICVDVEKITDFYLNKLLKEEKILLKLAKKVEYNDNLIAILKIASQKQIIGDVIDLTDENGNSALSVAILNENLGAFYYLLKKCHVHIPLILYHQKCETPFLIYIAKHGKMLRSDGKTLDYLLTHVLNCLSEYYPMLDFLQHFIEIDHETKLSLPHFLLNSYKKSVDMRPHIIECFMICIRKRPSCIETQCVNYDDPRYNLNVIAMLFSYPEIEVAEEFLQDLLKNITEDERIFLQELVKVQQDDIKRRRLLELLQ